jgi:hypothetical protein
LSRPEEGILPASVSKQYESASELHHYPVFHTRKNSFFAVNTDRVTAQTEHQTRRPQTSPRCLNVWKKLHEHNRNHSPLSMPATQPRHPLRFRAFNALVLSLSRRWQSAHLSISSPVISWAPREIKYSTQCTTDY